MSRMTRARAAQLAEDMHIDQDALLASPLDKDPAAHRTPEAPNARAPLGEIAPNSVACENSNDGTPDPKLGLPAPMRGVEKGLKRNKMDARSPRTVLLPTSLKDFAADSESAPSPMGVAAAEGLMTSVRAAGTSHNNTREAPPSSPSAVCSTRSQLLLVPEGVEPKSLVGEEQASILSEDVSIAAAGHHSSENINTNWTERNFHVDAAQSTPLSKSVKTAPTSSTKNRNSLHKDSPSRLKTPTTTIAMDRKSRVDSFTENRDRLSSYDELEAAAVNPAGASPPRSAAASSPRLQLEDPIEALDALNDAVEQVSAEVPDVQTSPEKPKPAKGTAANAPIVRTTKASQARISLAHGPKDASRAPALGRPRQSLAQQPDGKRVTSTSSNTSGKSELAKKKEVIIPHSKPRPVLMAFPAPPPPPKSSKAPTQSTFHLPGEAVATKLKAAKDARLAKEAELNAKKPFKARPVPAAMSKPAAVRQTSTSKARESMIGGKPAAPVQAHKRASSVVGSRSVGLGRAPSVRASLAPKPASAAPAPAISVVKRPSTAMAMAPVKTQVRTSSAAGAASRMSTARPSSVTQPRAASGTSKGKEVFNRAAEAKSSAEREKREKEEAARKARAEAAERGRVKSREWAERQRVKKLAGGVGA